MDSLAGHLSRTYDVTVAGLAQLDQGTFRVELSDREAWVVRVHPAHRTRERADGDAEILAWLGRHDYPAERLPAVADPVSDFGGRAIVVTEYEPSVEPARRREAIVAGGGLTGIGVRLSALQSLGEHDDAPAAARRPGGAWHHLAEGSPADELRAATAQLDALDPPPADRRHHETIAAAVAACDGGDGLPEALAHPDFVLANIVASPDRGLVLVDWTGTGRAARVWPLAFLLWAVGAPSRAQAGQDPARVDRVMRGWNRTHTLTGAEHERLEAIIAARPTTLESWSYATGRRSAAQAAHRTTEIRRGAAQIAAHVRRA